MGINRVDEMSFLCKNRRPSVVSTKRRVDDFFSTKCRVDEVTVDQVSCTESMYEKRITATSQV